MILDKHKEFVLPDQIVDLLNFEFKDEPEYGLKQYILVRTDRKFSRGKLMVHAAHNSVSALLYWFQRTKNGWDDNNDRIKKWFNSGRCQAKIALKVKNEEEIKKWVAKVFEFNPEIPTAIIKDGGAYEVEADCVIACSIGPVYPEEADELGLTDKSKMKLFR